MNGEPMTYNDGVKIASRALAVMLVLWAINDACYIPFDIIRALRALTHSTVSGPRYFYSAVMAAWIPWSLLRTGTWLLIASWFYECGPRVQKIFGCKPDLQ
jgi:hypothetical protein